MTEETEIKSAINIDEKTVKEIMDYFKTKDHDIFVGYIKKLGIEHND